MESAPTRVRTAGVALEAALTALATPMSADQRNTWWTH
jgi:hypothetical protein